MPTQHATGTRVQLAIGMRVQLSFVVHAPYTRRADLAIDDRLAMIVAHEDADASAATGVDTLATGVDTLATGDADGGDNDGGVWIAEDTHGDRHRIPAATLEAAADDPAQGRWRIEGAIPAYAIGERLLLHWRHRSMGRIANPSRPDQYCTVIAESTRTVTARLDDGSQIELFRWGSQADEPDRQAPRWFVMARG